MRRLLAHLKPGGRLVLAAPDAGSFWRRGMGRRQRGRFWRYALVCSSGLAINTGLMVALVEGLHWPYLLAQLSVIFIVPMTNFVLSRHWAFDAGAR